MTSLRFFAAFAIVLFHFSLLLDQHSFARSFTNQWWLGVDFFFILSGFVLMHAYVDEIITKNFSYYNFCIKRLARIYPLHFFTGALTGLVTFYGLSNGNIIDTGYSLGCVGASLLLLHAWGFENDYCFNLPSWSLSAEWFAYLLFPFLAVVFLRCRSEIFFILSLCFFVLLFFGFAAFFKEALTAQTYDFGFLRILPEFMVGMSFRYLANKYTFGKYAGYAVFFIFVLIVLALFLDASSFLVVILLAVLIFSAADFERHQTYWLCRAPMVYLGRLSFALYMVSYPVTVLFSSLFYVDIPIEERVIDFKLLSACFFSLAVMFPAAVLFHHDIEVPAQKWICKRFIRR